MSEKIDNPPDHKHSDYAGAPVVFLLVVSLFIIFAIMGGQFERRIDSIDDRLDREEVRAECRLAADEVACLREHVR